MGWKAWTRERLTVADLQHLLQDQAILQFPSAAAFDAAVPPGSRVNGMVRWLDDLKRHEWFDAASTTWFPLTPGAVRGKMWTTAGIVAIGVGTTQIDMTQGRVAGGVVFTASDNTLQVPLPGLYRVGINGYMYGGSVNGWNASFFAQRIRASVANATLVHTGQILKNNAEDMQPKAVDTVPLVANDKLAPYVAIGAGSGNYFGNSETGVSLTAEWVAPLNGATPL